MPYQAAEALPLLERTPAVLRALLADLPGAWTVANEGPDTWSAFDVVGHLIHGEKTDWIPRARMILEQGPDAVFEPFDRFAQLEHDAGRSLSGLLDEFAQLRRDNLVTLRGWQLSADQLALKGRHPELGPVTLSELLCTWVVHDLGHLAQIARVMARRHEHDVGPWKPWVPVLAPRPSAS